MSRPKLPTKRFVLPICICLTLLMLLLVTASGSGGSSPETDQEALEALFHATDGPNWAINSNWLTDVPPGDWYGVTTNENGRVTGLDLSANELFGGIPPELGNLDKLVVLDLTTQQTVTTFSGKVGIKIGGDSPSFGSQVEDAARKLAESAETTVRRNHLSGCIPINLRTQLDLNISDLGGLPFCDQMGAPAPEGEDPGADIVPITEAEEATFFCGEYGFGMGLGESDLPKVQCIIDKSQGKEGRETLLTGMMVDAIYSSNSEAVRLLLDSGVDASGRGPNGDPFLLHAISNAEVIAETLVDAGARIPESDEEEYIQLWFQNLGSPRDVRNMVHMGMDVNIRPFRDKTVSSGLDLSPAALKLDTALLKVVRSCEAVYSDEGRTDLEIVGVLVEAGADVNTMSLEAIYSSSAGTGSGISALGSTSLRALDESRTVLSIAEERGCDEVASILREAGACRHLEGRRANRGSKPNSVFAPREGVECAEVAAPSTQLERAIFYDDPQQLREMVATGADVNAPGASGKLPLQLAVGMSRVEIVKLLIELGADVNAPGASGELPLQLAVGMYRVEIVKLLIELGADVNAVDSSGETVLFTAVMDPDNADMVRALVEGSADVNAVDASGMTILQFARSFHSQEIISLLREAGAK